MYIKTDKTHVQTLHDREIMEKGYEVSFNENGVAQVKEEIGTELIAKYDSISENDN